MALPERRTPPHHHAPDRQAPNVSDKRAAYDARLGDAATDLRRHADELTRLRQTDSNDIGPEDYFTRGVQLLSSAYSDVRRHRESLAFLANAEPHRVPIPRLAAILGISINTFRSWLPRLNPPRLFDDPFRER